MPKSPQLVRNYFILPCCLLLLNLVNSIVSYKAAMIPDPVVRVAAVILMILVGSSLVAFLVAPAIQATVQRLHQTSRQGGGVFGELLFVCLLGLAIFGLYYQLTIHGPASLLPSDWRNPKF